MFAPSNFTAPKAKPLPVFLLLDVSGSMNEVIEPERVRWTGQSVENDGQPWELSVVAEMNRKPVLNFVFHATDADNIQEFFRKVTMSVTTRSKSRIPNTVPRLAKRNLEEEGGYW